MTGSPRIPGARAPLKDLKTGAEYTYSTSSVGGTRAVKHLVATYAWQLRAAPETTTGHLPVVEIGARSYKHADRKRGTIYNPIFVGVDWVPASAVLDKSGTEAAKPPAEMPVFPDYRTPKDKSKARARRATL